MKIIGYIHICQKGEWIKPYDMIIDAVKKHGLYDITDEIRCGVVNDEGILNYDNRFNDSKIKIIYTSTSDFFERKTLEHMRLFSEIDPDCNYWYAHTKGITHFGTGDTFKEECVIDWIKLLIFWNLKQWHLAVEKLKEYKTYGCSGCNHHHVHYSGNFWWATKEHIKTLPKKIGSGYTDPEFWICINLNYNEICNIFSTGLEGGGHYSNKYPQHLYALPEGFSCDAYRFHNFDLKHLSDDRCVYHWYNHGMSENRRYSY